MRVLIAEDDRDMNRIITKKLTKEGYGVDSSFDGEDALFNIRHTDYDVIILDIMMPKMDGLQVLTEIRKLGIETPVIFLTAKDAIEDRVKGLDNGANDYLVKPFSFEELMARIRVMTRIKAGKATSILTVADLSLDTSSHKVYRGEVEIILSAREYSILEYMMYNSGQVLSRVQIEDHIFSYDYEGGSNLVDVYIRYLRKKIDEGFKQKLIHTVRGTGYVIREN